MTGVRLGLLTVLTAVLMSTSCTTILGDFELQEGATAGQVGTGTQHGSGGAQDVGGFGGAGGTGGAGGMGSASGGGAVSSSTNTGSGGSGPLCDGMGQCQVCAGCAGSEELCKPCSAECSALYSCLDACQSGQGECGGAQDCEECCKTKYPDSVEPLLCAICDACKNDCAMGAFVCDAK